MILINFLIYLIINHLKNDKEEDNISLSLNEYKSDYNNKKYDMEIDDISNKTISSINIRFTQQNVKFHINVLYFQYL